MSAEALLLQPAHVIAQAVRRRDCSVLALAEAAAARLQATDGVVNAFTQRTLQRAFGRAAALDARLAAGDTTAQALPLAGVPYAVKNLFDIEGVVTLAGSKIERDRAPAGRDAVLVQRLDAAGAVLLGALNMDEFAYGFTTENARRADTQPARPHARGRWLVGRIGGRGGRRPGAADAGLRHQWLDPRAGLAVRRLRAQAHLRPPAAHRQLPLRGQPRPPGAVRAQRARPGPGLRRDAGAR
jgi:hypothetical protein